MPLSETHHKVPQATHGIHWAMASRKWPAKNCGTRDPRLLSSYQEVLGTSCHLASILQKETSHLFNLEHRQNSKQ